MPRLWECGTVPHQNLRRAGRVAEGAPLLRVYRFTPIEGSNPSLSAILLKNPYFYRLKNRLSNKAYILAY